jgi:uncharacterized phage protein gp47/JayE
MPLNTKSFTDFVRQIQGKFMKELPAIDPTVKASLAGSSVVSTAAGAVSLQEGIKDAVRQSFWQTQDGDFLELTGELNDTPRFDPQEAQGQATATGVLSTLIPADTPLTFNGNTYLNVQDSTIQEFSGGISLSFSAGIVTVVTDLVHTLATGLSVTISGATQTDYNGTFEIIVLDNTTFTYDLTAGSLTTDNGTYTVEYALLNVESSGTGAVQNVASGGILTIDLTDIDDNVFVGTDGIDGGSDEESEEDYRERTGESYSLTPGIATPPSLVASAKSIPGNTRVFVVRPDGTSGGVQGSAGYKPELGETVIYILRDNDQSILPSSAVLTATKDQIIADGLWPTFTPDDLLYVLAPILQTQDFVFTSISPNTITMQNAIRDQLVSFFEDNSEIEGTISLEKTLNPFLQKVTDPSTGALLSSFTYTTPSADIVAGSGEIYTVGTVTFP